MAGIVKEFFDLCTKSYGTAQIAEILEERGIDSLCTHYIKTGRGCSAQSSKTTKDTHWNANIIYHMLNKTEYLRHTVYFRTRNKSYKCKKKIVNDPSEYKIFENTHEPIIPPEVFETDK